MKFPMRLRHADYQRIRRVAKDMPSLRILADENIPLVRELFGQLGSVRCMGGREITRENVRTSDVLLVRSVTPVEADLLAGSAVRFVGSATIGVDHIDTEYLDANDIAWVSTPGANAESVVEYVLAALLRLAVRKGEPLREKTLGIVGCGRIGGRLAPRAEALGMTVLKNDPPRQEEAERAGRPHDFRPLFDVLSRSHIVTCHVPLTRSGPHPTRHLIGEGELAALGTGTWLVNTSRGAVVDNAALLRALVARNGRPAAAVLDVWEDEPNPSADLVARVDIATPHIAGYSYEGKVAATLMLLEALAAYLGVKPPESAPLIDTRILSVGAPDPILPETEWLHHLVCSLYDIGEDDRRMRGRSATWTEPGGAHFTRLRREYPKRRSFGAYRIQMAQLPQAYHAAAVDGVGIGLRSVPIGAEV